jgi:hypothetical protein
MDEIIRSQARGKIQFRKEDASLPPIVVVRNEEHLLLRAGILGSNGGKV